MVKFELLESSNRGHVGKGKLCTPSVFVIAVCNLLQPGRLMCSRGSVWTLRKTQFSMYPEMDGENNGKPYKHG